MHHDRDETLSPWKRRSPCSHLHTVRAGRRRWLTKVRRRRNNVSESKHCPLCRLPNPIGARRCGGCDFAFDDWERRGSPQICQECGVEAETRQVAFHQHIGAAILMFHSRVEGRLCKTCINTHFFTKTAITSALGWWGFFSFFITPFVLLHNVGRYLFCFRMRPPASDAPHARAVRMPGQPRVTRQLVGQNCVHCGERISCSLDGEFCLSCGSPAHINCVKPGNATGCPLCGAVSAVP